MKRKVVLVLLFVIIIAITSIGFGVYFNRLSKPNAIFRSVLDSLGDRFERYTKLDNDLDVGDQIHVEGNIKFELDSEYYFNRYFLDLEAEKKYNTLIHLNEMDTSYVISQDKKNQKSYIELQEMLGEETLLLYKLFIKDSTEYYYLNDVADSYVNNGTCNYYETLGEEVTTQDNIDYLNRFLLTAIENNVKNEYFQNYVVDQTIDGKKKSMNQISLRLTDSLIHKILKGILKDFKEDERAYKIISNVYPDFSHFKISDEKIFLEKDETYTVNIYTTKFLYTPLKIEILHMKGDQKNLIVYEGNYNNGTLYYSENDQTIYMMPVKISSHQLEVDILDMQGNHLGEVRFDKNQHNLMFNYSFDNGVKKKDIIYSSKYQSLKKKKSYENEQKISFKIIENKESKYNGTITVNQKVSNTVKIDEDESTAILASSLTEEQKSLLENKKNQVKERLEQR